MADDKEALSDFDERLLQGVLARIWRHLGGQRDSTSRINKTVSPEELKRRLDLAVRREGIDIEEMLSDIDTYLAESVNTSHPHFMNPLWGGTNIASFAGEIITALTNTSMYTYEIAPMATLIENEMIATMGKLVGYEAGEGIFTTGGSNANLIGMLCARDRKLPDAPTDGIQGKELVAFISEDAHYSTIVAANILGIGKNNLIPISCDDEGKMIPELLEESIITEKRAGKIPFCVVATAGTTVVGAIDPLEEIGEICRREYLWLHVDAAWGGAALLSPKTRGLLRGIEKADSIGWDPHKMMGIQLVCSVLLVRNSGTLNKVCSHADTAHYLFSNKSKNYDLGRKSLQCGRRVDALKLWLAWRAKGDEGWRLQIEKYFSIAKYFADQVIENPLLELVIEPSMTNVCFRYTGARLTQEKQDTTNEQIRTELLASGRFMISTSLINGRTILRGVVANPSVSELVVDELLTTIVKIGNELSQIKY
ncbi:MAG: aminotransferase class V-fold PLP-dependent enzyme [Candidatus Thalassarchaeaceae archaeon]|nr:aminotransferase class V-fold PLP-dependent enzyme [Candidatus Thalassarchaeaceae archaeon]